MKSGIYRVLVVLLLAAIVGVQVWGMFAGSESEECQEAMTRLDSAILAGDVFVDSSVVQYDQAVYNTATNINQQILFANEFQFLALRVMVQQNEAMLRVASECR